MRPTYSPTRPSPKSTMPRRKKARISRSQRVAIPSRQPERMSRWTMTIRYVSSAPTETSMPNIENICSGTSEKSGDEIEIQADELVERIFRLAGYTLGVLDFDLSRVVCVGIGEGRNVGADLARRRDRAHDVTAVRTQHAALIGHRDAGDALANTVHRFRCDATPP